MSVKAWEKYQPNASSPSPQYPYGSLRQETALGVGDGTPLDVEWGNDFEAFKQTAFSRSGLVPSGNTDTVTNSEMFNAMQDSTTRTLWKRSAAESGYNLVAGSFEEGGTLVNTNDVLWSKKLNKIFSGPAGTVAAGTNPASGGFVDRSHLLLSSSVPVRVDYYKYPTTTDTEAIDAAMAASTHVIFGPRKYTYTKELVSVGHTLDGVVSETFGGSGTVIEFDLTATPASGFAFRNTSKKGCVNNIRFIQKNWNIPLNGLRVDRLIDGRNIDFSYFNGHGAVLTSVDSLNQTCYSSSLTNITCDHNAKHGIVLGGAANAVVIDNPKCRWNGSPAYGVQPSTPGVYDGIYSGGKNSEFPGNPAVFNDPQGVVIIGGDLSYNSRIGLNLDRFFDGAVLGGYGEFNLVDDLKIRAIYGSNIVNFMAQDLPDIAVPDVDPLNAGIGLATYPNRIIVRGVSYGIGKMSATNKVYEVPMDSLVRVGSLGTLRLIPTVDGGLRAEKSGGNAIKTHFGNVPLLARQFAMGDGFLDADTVTRSAPTIRRAGNVEGDEALIVETGSQSLRLFVANGGSSSTAATGAIIPKNATTNRSVNAGGTVNTSGADYAEYMRKSDGCGELQKGAICGVDANGMLTDRFDEAISFVIKSTDPSFVGGDTWFTEEEPAAPINSEGDEDFLNPEYLEELSAYRQRLEIARNRVDRIAFSGQVPVNVVGAKPGDFIVPARNDDGAIVGIPVSKPTQDEYQISVGKVWRVLDDGRAFVAVKIA